MIRNNLKKGFTLIELLVVVAIIGILASVVLAALNNAREKGVNAAIKGSVSNARSQAALYYEDNGQIYEGVCANITGGIGSMILSAVEKLNPLGSVGADIEDFVYDSSGAVAGSAVCHDSDTAWAAIVSLKAPTTPDAGWCADSTGASREATTLLGDETICP